MNLLPLSYLWLQADSTDEAPWQWDNGANFTYANWGPGEPSGGTEDCAHMQSGTFAIRKKTRMNFCQRISLRNRYMPNTVYFELDFSSTSHITYFRWVLERSFLRPQDGLCLPDLQNPTMQRSGMPGVQHARPVRGATPRCDRQRVGERLPRDVRGRNSRRRN